MRQIGVFLVILGIGSIILNEIGLEFRALMWLGEGYGIRIGIACLGIVAFLSSSEE